MMTSRYWIDIWQQICFNYKSPSEVPNKCLHIGSDISSAKANSFLSTSIYCKHDWHHETAASKIKIVLLNRN